jgi:hypothetical protein
VGQAVRDGAGAQRLADRIVCLRAAPRPAVNTRFSSKTTITAEVIRDPKITWKSEGNLL